MTIDPQSGDKIDQRPLIHLLDAVDRAADRQQVTVAEIFAEIGDRTILPVILLVAILLVSPLSGIPGMPTLAAIVITILSAQALMDRGQLWLPGFIMRRTIAGPHLSRAVGWLRPAAAWIDRHSRPRLRMLTVGPMRFLVLMQCAVIPLGWPALEVFPTISSFGAGTVALFAFGLFTRDGLYVLAGYFWMILIAAIVFWVLRTTL